MSLSKREAAIRLWRTCFDDPVSFISLYFGEVYRDEDTLLRYNEEGTAIAHVQILPYQIQIGKKTVPAGYISGACTDPQYRGVGIMHGLMHEALRAMYDRGDLCSFLIPAEESLYQFYMRQGDYAAAFGKDAITYTPTNKTLPPLYEIKLGQGHYEFLSANEEKEPSLIVRHSLRQWQTAVADLSLAGGGVASLFDEKGDVIAEAYYVPRNERLEIKLLLGDRENASLLVDLLLQKLHCYEASILQPSCDKPYGMIRILRLQPFLEAMASSFTETLSFCYEDPLFPENNGFYQISNGQVSFSDKASFPLERYTPSSLSEKLFSPFSSALFLMLD